MFSVGHLFNFFNTGGSKADCSERHTSFYKVDRTEMAPKTKVLHDAVHPHMEIPEICLKIINTPTFQRLKNLKQLATCYFVYPSASHNRYEHCIGTGYLAGEFGRILQKKLRDQEIIVPAKRGRLEISDKDILCLQIAGLCHDVGHGPFSHTWEKFVKAAGCSDYEHEETSLKLFDHMVEQNSLKIEFANNDPPLNGQDIQFIKSLMIGKKNRMENGKEVDVGRGEEMHFLYEIVANEISKVDVDKFDYLLRDCKLLNLTTAFDYRRVMMNSKVCLIEDENRWGIVYNKKVAEDVEDLFRGRYRMHQRAYQHKTNKIVEEMLLDGFKLADTYGTTFLGSEHKLSEAYKDPALFIKLTDSIFEVILNNWTGKIPVEASDLFKRIVTGNHYQCLGYVSLNYDEKIPESFEKIPNLYPVEASSGYGGKDNENPLEQQYFFDYDIDGTERFIKLEFGKAPTEKKYFLVVKNKGQKEEVLQAIKALRAHDRDRISFFHQE